MTFFCFLVKDNFYLRILHVLDDYSCSFLGYGKHPLRAPTLCPWQPPAVYPWLSRPCSVLDPWGTQRSSPAIRPCLGAAAYGHGAPHPGACEASARYVPGRIFFSFSFYLYPSLSLSLPIYINICSLSLLSLFFTLYLSPSKPLHWLVRSFR